MPHQCVKCSRVIPTGSKELLEGCSGCHSRFFFYVREEQFERLREKVIEIKQKKLIKKFKNSKVIVDAPLLLESDSRKLVGKIVVVKCDDKARIRRLLKKGKLTKEQINKITKFQMPMEKKLKFADFVIDNSKDLKNLENLLDGKKFKGTTIE